MDKQKVAKVLVSVARELTATRFNTGVRDLDDSMSDIERPIKALVEARKDLTGALAQASLSGAAQDFRRMASDLSDAELYVNDIITEATRARNFIRKAKDRSKELGMIVVQGSREASAVRHGWNGTPGCSE